MPAAEVSVDPGGPLQLGDTVSAARVQRAHVDASALSDVEGLRKDHVAVSIERNLDQFVACYQRDLAVGALEGGLSLKVVVGADGNTTSVAAKRMPEELDDLAVCVGKRLMRIDWIPPELGWGEFVWAPVFSLRGG